MIPDLISELEALRDHIDVLYEEQIQELEIEKESQKKFIQTILDKIQNQ